MGWEDVEMSIYRCSKCGCIENTATSNYWSRRHPSDDAGNSLPPLSELCSECDPHIGHWHGVFKKTSANGFFLCSDGFLAHKDELETDNFKFRMKHQGLKVIEEIME